MKINTTRFGEIEYSADRVIFFEEGLLGLEGLKKYILITPEDIQPLNWLQSVDDSDIAMVVVNPFNIKPDYSPVVPDDCLKELKIEDGKDIILLNVVVIPDDYKKMTVNLAAPIVINAKKCLGKQVILSQNYPIRYPVFGSKGE
ncbi:MAG: flagellar assembly protein FliW [Xylanivirga thermophila]|jgi:flagellar assembly factor FliW|uniref:flagellar assembly protein FliW n=1 Tax=Xylanivirga thermophila TaxID=2496273 RepID=UPI0039F470C4